MKESWVRFSQPFRFEGRKTQTWRVTSAITGAVLGQVYWYVAWRCYVFEPYGDTIYEQRCLRDIATFCEARTRELREHWKPRGRAAEQQTAAQEGG